MTQDKTNILSDTKKRGRKAGGHNTKQRAIIGDPAKQFSDPVNTAEFQCYKCGHTSGSKFKYCSECGSENIWS